VRGEATVGSLLTTAFAPSVSRRGVYNSVRMRYGIHIEFATATTHRSLQ
jgi:hypothetical protein